MGFKSERRLQYDWAKWRRGSSERLQSCCRDEVLRINGYIVFIVPVLDADASLVRVSSPCTPARGGDLQLIVLGGSMASPATAMSLRATLRPRKGRIGVVIADASPLGCELLKQVVGSHPCIRVMGTISAHRSYWREIDRSSSGITPDKRGLVRRQLVGSSVVSELHASFRVFQLSYFAIVQAMNWYLASFRAGASGFLCRSDSLGKICKCIQVVHRGQIWASSSQLQVLLGVVVQAPSVRIVNAKGLSLLAERERQVVALVSEGLSNREIRRPNGHQRAHSKQLFVSHLQQARHFQSSGTGLVCNEAA